MAISSALFCLIILIWRHSKPQPNALEPLTSSENSAYSSRLASHSGPSKFDCDLAFKEWSNGISRVEITHIKEEKVLSSIIINDAATIRLAWNSMYELAQAERLELKNLEVVKFPDHRFEIKFYDNSQLSYGIASLKFCKFDTSSEITYVCYGKSLPWDRWFRGALTEKIQTLFKKELGVELY